MARMVSRAMTRDPDGGLDRHLELLPGDQRRSFAVIITP
jgi:hypothetical protein